MNTAWIKQWGGGLWLVGLLSLSWVGFYWSEAAPVILLMIGVALVWVGCRHPSIVVYASLLELLVGGQGHLVAVTFHGFVFSIRYVLLFTVLIISIVHRSTVWPFLRTRRALWLAPMILLGWVIISIGWGLFQQYPLSRVLTDANAFGALLMVPLWAALVAIDQNWQSRLVTQLITGLITITGLTFISGLLFQMQPPWVVTYYHWIRATGLGEIAPIGHVTYRLFFQSQIYAGLVLLLFLGGAFREQISRRTRVSIVMLCTAALLFSLSRSFWLGLVVGVGVLCAAILIRKWSVYLRVWIVPMLVGVVIGFFLFSWGSYFPYVTPHVAGQSSALLSRINDSGALLSAAARQNQIRPLLHEIMHNPIIGRGFGAQARYFNPDPRNHGWRETSAFELGYLDWTLKMGLIGLGLLAWWAWTLLTRARRHPAFIGILTSGTALFAIHLTTPYLNHPLGIGWLAFVSLLIYVA